MKFKVFNKNKSGTKVAFFHEKSFGTTLSESINIEKICQHNNIEVHLLHTDINHFLEFKDYKNHIKLDSIEDVKTVYEFIFNYLNKNNIKICIFFGSGYPWTTKFLERIKKISYIACYFGDDPEGAKYTSMYYVKNYHYAFCGGIYFDNKVKIKEKYLQWGARKSEFIPLGANPIKYSNTLNTDKREFEIVYVGGAYLKKILRIYRLKKYFGERMILYGRGWNGMSDNFIKKSIFKFIKWLYDVPYIEELPEHKLVELYQNAKIGFNMHMSYGPSNLRLYELPMNGVMQICDCKNGLRELYEIDKEVVAYSTLREAIDKIEYYLTHEKERLEIAFNGYKKAKDAYVLEKSFSKILNIIYKDIADNFKQYKNE